MRSRLHLMCAAVLFIITAQAQATLALSSITLSGANGASATLSFDSSLEVRAFYDPADTDGSLSGSWHADQGTVFDIHAAEASELSALNTASGQSFTNTQFTQRDSGNTFTITGEYFLVKFANYNGNAQGGTALFQILTPQTATGFTFSYDGPRDVSHVAEVASAVPLPAAAWLFGSALLGMLGLGARRKMKG